MVSFSWYTHLMNKLKIATFNVSGGFYIGNEKDEYLDRKPAKTSDDKLFRDIIDLIRNESVDVICFQEIITGGTYDYIGAIQDVTNMGYAKRFELSPCNTVKNARCGLAILSRFPLESIKEDIFPNPCLAKTTESGKTYYTYDKGYMVCDIATGLHEKVRILNHHGFPYRRFNSTPEANQDVFNFFSDIISETNPDFVVGDFNAVNFMALMPKVAVYYEETFNGPTTVDGMNFDNILITSKYRAKTKTIETHSDHLALVSQISY